LILKIFLLWLGFSSADVTEHISSGKAAILLQALNSRQKGGWLARGGGF